MSCPSSTLMIMIWFIWFCQFINKSVIFYPVMEMHKRCLPLSFTKCSMTLLVTPGVSLWGGIFALNVYVLRKSLDFRLTSESEEKRFLSTLLFFAFSVVIVLSALFCYYVHCIVVVYAINNHLRLRAKNFPPLSK